MSHSLLHAFLGLYTQQGDERGGKGSGGKGSGRSLHTSCNSGNLRWQGTVLEQPDGETLTDRICRRPISPDGTGERKARYIFHRCGPGSVFGHPGQGMQPIQLEFPRPLSDEESLSS